MSGSLGTDKQPECRPEPGSGRIEKRARPYLGAEGKSIEGSSAAAPVHANPMPWLTFPALVARIQWHIPPAPRTAAAHASGVDATETIVGAVDGPSTKV